MTDDKVQEKPKAPKAKTFNASELADALGFTRHEFNVLVKYKELNYDTEITESKLKKLFKKYFGGE